MPGDRDTGSEGRRFGAAGIHESGRVLRLSDHKVVGVRMGTAAAENGDDRVLGEGGAVASQGQVFPGSAEIIHDLFDRLTAGIGEIRISHFGRVASQEHGPAQCRDDGHTLGVASAGKVVGSLHQGRGQLGGELAVEHDVGAETRDNMVVNAGDHIVDNIGMAACTVDDHAGLKTESAVRVSI